jgi:hypothetical protein
MLYSGVYVSEYIADGACEVCRVHVVAGAETCRSLILVLNCILLSAYVHPSEYYDR